MSNKSATKSTNFIEEALGWIGVLFILAAYALITLRVLDASSLAYGLLNALGAIGIMVSSYFKRDFQPVLLNLVWLVVAVIGIIGSFSLA